MVESSRIVLFADPVARELMPNVAWFLYTNPCDPAWALREQACLPGCQLPEDRAPDEVVARISKGFQRIIAEAAAQLRDGGMAVPEEMAAYRGAAVYALWDRYRAEIQKIIDTDSVEVPFWDDYVASYQSLLFDRPVFRLPEPGHLLSLMYQWRRTVFYTSTKILGRSPSAAAARAAIYQASMGGEICAYARGLYRSMDDVPVLITGETGTGKELAAQCIGWSRYIPLDQKERRFVMSHRAGMHARNLCEVPRDLIESALFGHKRGSFTGATADATGFFALPEAHGALFLDEIGEIPEHIQVKLLRPLESREIVAVGDTKTRPIRGRHLFATNKDLEAKCRAGEFRPDLLERLNGVRIHMPSLRTMIAEDPAELGRYVRGFLATKLDDDGEVEAWTTRVVRYIGKELRGHSWTRNLRELKHFTERYLLSNGKMPKPAVIALPPAAPEVEAPAPATAAAPAPEGHRAPESVCMPSSGLVGANAKRGGIPVDDILRAYVTEVFANTNQNVSETARLTGLSRRTVSRLIDRARLARLLARRR